MWASKASHNCTCPPLYAVAPPAQQDIYLALAVYSYEVNYWFEMCWGIARGGSFLLFGIAMLQAKVFPKWLHWMSFLCAAELLYRILAIAKGFLPTGPQDLFFVVWMVAVGVAMARARTQNNYLAS